MFGRKKSSGLSEDVARNLTIELSRLNNNIERTIPALTRVAQNVSNANVIISGNALAQVAAQLQQCCLELQNVRQGLDARVGGFGFVNWDSAFSQLYFQLKDIANILRNIEGNQNRLR